jgi:transposase InsO family protein
MDGRRRLASLVLDSGWSVTAAARELGVSRQTAHEWVQRAKLVGLAKMDVKSRRPGRSPRRADDEITSAVMEIAEKYPFWGPKKLYALLWPAGEAPVCERTVARILARNSRHVVLHQHSPAADSRFEREESNQLWQTDFKRVGFHRTRSDSMSVVDDAHRFCIALTELADQTLDSAWSVLWEAFGEFGLPEQMLSDNGPAFRNNATWRWSQFDLRLMLLGIRSCHGRPYHPQTQGKVERFHGTMQREISFEKDCDVQEELRSFRDRYNWTRPHESLDMRTPGSLYSPSPRLRPATMPEPFFPEGAIIRKCHDNGVIKYKGGTYKLGKALTGLPIGILTTDNEPPKVVWGNFILASLEDMKV